MQVHKPSPNLLLVGAPKCGTTSLMAWLREHPEIFHPWEKSHRNAAESGFLISGIIDLPYHPSFRKGDLVLPDEINMNHYKGQKWILDKSTQHLYSKRALSTISGLMPDSKVIIMVRNPYELFISYHSMILNKTLYYDTPLETLISQLDIIDWRADEEDPKTWPFVSYPKFSKHIISWIEELGENRVRVIPLESLKDPKGVLEQLSTWLDIDINSIPKKFPNQNTGGALSNSKFSKFLREPPSWAFNLSRFILPSRNLRKLLLDPIRRKGWKHVKMDKKPISAEVERYIKEQLSDEIHFFENLEDYIPSVTIIS